MAHTLSKSTTARAAWRREAVVPRRRRRHEAARVLVAWSSPLDIEEGHDPVQVFLELEASSSLTAGGTWRCRELAGAGWVEAISAARCSEVVLTARLGDDGRARHLVLELAELLTQRLSVTKPQIRVRFLPPIADAGTLSAQSA